MTRARRKPLDPDLYADVVEEAKARFAVWPSAYASGWVVKTYKARGGRYAGATKGERTGLTKWFGEEWVDLSRPTADGGYEPCGRKKSDDPTDYPKCRPLKEAMRMSPSEVADAVRRKRRAEASAPGRGSRARAPKRVATYRKNPLLTPEAVLTGDEAAEIEALADAHGKQAGFSMETAHDLVREKGDHVLVRVPVGPEYLRLDSDEPGHEEIGARRTREYAQLDTEPPPIRIGFGPRAARQGLTSAVVWNGNHRVRAARLQGRPSLLAMMPVEDFHRWQAALDAGARANPEGIDGDALAAWCASDESYAVLDETASANSSWMAGACVLLAKALVAAHPEAQLVGLEVDGDVQHVGALVGDVVYDALGAHDERTWARDWLAYEQLHPRTPARLVSLPPGVPASVLPDVEAPATARDVRLVARALPA